MGEKKITEELQLIIKKQTEVFSQNGEISPLEKANEMYNSLVKKGVIKKRGYTLMGINHNPFSHNRFNQ